MLFIEQSRTWHPGAREPGAREVENRGTPAGSSTVERCCDAGPSCIRVNTAS